MNIRLDKFISVNTGFSRNEIRMAAKRGKITVNGIVENSFGTKINTETDNVCIYGENVNDIGNVYIIINKPKGVISATDDTRQKTVIDLLPEKYSHLRLFPVGRLDRDTTGLLIITNDGDFAHKVISPKSGIEKCYEVELDGKLEDNLKTEFKNGVKLFNETLCKPAELSFLSDCTALVKITEGKYHQIKRMFGVYGLGVNNLHRKSIGNLVLPENLKPGEFIEVTYDEIMNKILKTL